MGRFVDLTNENLENKVKNMAKEIGLPSQGITIEVCGLKKTKKDVGEVIKSNDLVERFTNDDSIVVVALNERAFDLVDEETQNIWIENLLSQISYSLEKDKIVITKPELNVPVGMYRKYGELAVKKCELALLTVEQINEEEKQARAMAKEAKKGKKKNIV